MSVWGWAYAGNAFGERSAVGAYHFMLRFEGQYYDVETGLHYNTYRDYSPSFGAYAEVDPLGLRNGSTSYGYVGSNPLGFIDPLGLQRVLVLEVRKGSQQLYWLSGLLSGCEPGECGQFFMESRLKRTAEASEGCEYDHYESRVETGPRSFRGIYLEWPQTISTKYIYKTKSACKECTLSGFEDERETFSPPETDWEPGDLGRPYNPTGGE